MIKFEEYKTAVISTAHLTKMDAKVLERKDTNMIAKRSTGFFLKLYADELQPNLLEVYSDSLKQIITVCWSQGYECIEFDCDADTYRPFRTFDW